MSREIIPYSYWVMSSRHVCFFIPPTSNAVLIVFMISSDSHHAKSHNICTPPRIQLYTLTQLPFITMRFVVTWAVANLQCLHKPVNYLHWMTLSNHKNMRYQSPVIYSAVSFLSAKSPHRSQYITLFMSIYSLTFNVCADIVLEYKYSGFARSLLVTVLSLQLFTPLSLYSLTSVGSDTDLYFIAFTFYQLQVFINYRLAKCNCSIAAVLEYSSQTFIGMQTM